MRQCQAFEDWREQFATGSLVAPVVSRLLPRTQTSVCLDTRVQVDLHDMLSSLEPLAGRLMPF